MTTHAMTVLHSSVEPNWRTPPDCFAALDREFHFCLDAAANAQDHLCASWYGPGSPWAEDALQTSWRIGGDHTTVFVNPPFSRTLATKLNATVSGILNPYRIENWVRKCWMESRDGCTIVGIIPFAPQTDWYRKYVYGHQLATEYAGVWSGHAALQERRLPHRISFLTPEGAESNNAGVNSAIVVWGPATGMVGPWQPHQFYWSYR